MIDGIWLMSHCIRLINETLIVAYRHYETEHSSSVCGRVALKDYPGMYSSMAKTTRPDTRVPKGKYPT